MLFVNEAHKQLRHRMNCCVIHLFLSRNLLLLPPLLLLLRGFHSLRFPQELTDSSSIIDRSIVTTTPPNPPSFIITILLLGLSRSNYRMPAAERAGTLRSFVGEKKSCLLLSHLSHHPVFLVPRISTRCSAQNRLKRFHAFPVLHDNLAVQQLFGLTLSTVKSSSGQFR